MWDLLANVRLAKPYVGHSVGRGRIFRWSAFLSIESKPIPSSTGPSLRSPHLSTWICHEGVFLQSARTGGMCEICRRAPEIVGLNE